MNYYLISDEQLDLIDNAEGVEILRHGRRDLRCTAIMDNDGTYTIHYNSDEEIKDGEVLVHFYLDSIHEEDKSLS